MPLNEITPVQTVLASRDRPLSLRPLDALQARPAPYQALLCQPGGTLESSPQRIGNLDSTAAAPAYRALLGKATTSHADLVLTPEYSVPWSVFNDIIQGHLIPPEGALWALGFESITPVELRRLAAAVASAAQPTVLSSRTPQPQASTTKDVHRPPRLRVLGARGQHRGGCVVCAGPIQDRWLKGPRSRRKGPPVPRHNGLQVHGGQKQSDRATRPHLFRCVRVRGSCHGTTTILSSFCTSSSIRNRAMMPTQPTDAGCSR